VVHRSLPDIDRGFVPRYEKAGSAPAFLLEMSKATAAVVAFDRRKK
jgi:hypothetical protein